MALIKKSLAKLRDVRKRHHERHSPLGLRFAIADRIDFLNGEHWDAIANGGTIFLSRDYLRAIERHSPNNISLRYALIYRDSRPVAILACQIADLAGEQFFETSAKPRARSKLLRKIRQRMLVCGNLISSGLHGVGFAPDLEPELGWRAVAEALYRIRRGDKLHGTVDFAMIKDLKGDHYRLSSVLRRYSYRPVKTDPDMVLTFDDGCTTFDNYLSMLTSKYRSRLKKIRQTLIDSGFAITSISDLARHDAELHALYLEVEKRAAVRLATIAPGYFAAMANALGDNFRCTVLTKGDQIAGFIVTLKDGDLGIAYYVGLDYSLNEQYPVYLGLLQLSVEDALAMGCRKLSMGRSALEPKASLGAKPVHTHVWLRHRLPAVNAALRKFFPMIPYDEAPERHSLKSDRVES